MVASSEQQSAPVIVNKPASAHASSSQPGAPLSRDDSADVIKIPDPIIEPITIMVASIGPSARTRPDCFWLSSRFFMIELWIQRSHPLRLKSFREALGVRTRLRVAFGVTVVECESGPRTPRTPKALRANTTHLKLFGALILTPSRSSCVRNSRANSTAPGVSP